MTTTATRRTSFPSLRYLAMPFRWAVRTRRRRWILASILSATIATPALWWPLQLAGLPDIGDPVGLEAVRLMTIPDSQNAFVLYRRAVERLKPWTRPLAATGRPIDRLVPWSRADPLLRRWVEENGAALVLYRQGSDRPDALDLGPEAGVPARLMGDLLTLAMLEASRLEEQGDMEGAWQWYRAALRTIHHLGRRARLSSRYWPHRLLSGRILDRAARWSADRRTTPAMIRRALDDVLACEALAPSETYTLAMEYPDLLWAFDDLSQARREMSPWIVSVGPVQAGLSPEQVRALYNAWRWWRREPERSRRVLRLVVAHWMAYEELPPSRRPPPDPDVSGAFDFYALGPGTPAKARLLRPAALDRWLASTIDASELLRAWDFRGTRIQERASHRALVVLLASELYRRDHGSDPPSDEALVGSYLEKLPDDGLGDAGGAKDGGGSAGPEGIR